MDLRRFPSNVKGGIGGILVPGMESVKRFLALIRSAGGGVCLGGLPWSDEPL
jgi:hypothetical protein